MKIVKAENTYLSVSVKTPVTEKPRDVGVLLVTIETDTGIRGIGVAREHDKFCRAVRSELDGSLFPYMVGRDPLSADRL